MDWTFVPGIDLTRDPVVTRVDGGEMRAWPGCRIFVPEPLGDADPDEAKAPGCRSHHGANQEPVGAILDALWPKLAECRTAKELGAAIIDARVDAGMKFKLACLARERMHATWTNGLLRHWLAPKSHTDERLTKMRDTSRAWKTKNLEKAQGTARKGSRAWRADNREHVAKKQKTRLKDDPVFAVSCRLRARLSCAVKAAGVGKSAGTFKLVGLTPEQLAEHLERHFLPGMTWENLELWHVDHIRPLSSYDLTDPEQQAVAMHWSNLAPVWAADNLAKSSWHNGKRHRYRKPE